MGMYIDGSASVHHGLFKLTLPTGEECRLTLKMVVRRMRSRFPGMQTYLEDGGEEDVVSVLRNADLP